MRSFSKLLVRPDPVESPTGYRTGFFWNPAEYRARLDVRCTPGHHRCFAIHMQACFQSWLEAVNLQIFLKLFFVSSRSQNVKEGNRNLSQSHTSAVAVLKYRNSIA